MAYRIQIVRAAQKQLLSFPKELRSEIASDIDSLVNDPRPAKCKKLRGTGLWRLRLGHYRAVYAIDDKSRLITVLKVAIRREDT